MEHAIVLVWRKLKIYGILQNILFILLESKYIKTKSESVFPYFFFLLFVDRFTCSYVIFLFGSYVIRLC